LLFDVQVATQNAHESPTLLEYPDGYHRLSLRMKPIHIHLAEGFRVSLQKATWRSVDGKKISSATVVRRLKPGSLVLLSADGNEVDPAYLRLFQPGTLVLIVPAGELPIPYFPHMGGSILVQKIGDGGGR
jgi:hypothetical protein